AGADGRRAAGVAPPAESRVGGPPSVAPPARLGRPGRDALAGAVRQPRPAVRPVHSGVRRPVLLGRPRRVARPGPRPTPQPPPPRPARRRLTRGNNAMNPPPPLHRLPPARPPVRVLLPVYSETATAAR